MASSAVRRREFPEGSLVYFRNKLCIVTEKNDSYGYNVYKVRAIEETEENTAFSYQLDFATEQEELVDEFSQEFIEDSAVREEPHARFENITEEEKKEFVNNQKNSNTENKTRRDYQLLKSYLLFAGDEREAEQIPPGELNKYLEDFFVVVKKQNGESYEPSTIRGIMASINRYLTERNYTDNIMTSRNFTGMKEIASAKFKVRYDDFRMIQICCK